MLKCFFITFCNLSKSKGTDVKMKKSIKLLIILNLITYANGFIFSLMYAYNNAKLTSEWGIYGIWVLSPYLFLTITSFILAIDNNKNYKIFYKEAIVDWILRFISCCIFFQQFDFKFLSWQYIVQQLIAISLLATNLLIEIIMYRKVINYKLNFIDENKVEEEVTEKEKRNIRNMGKATTIGVSSFFVFTAGGLSAPLISQTLDNSITKAIMLVASITILIWYLNKNYEKCILFYLDKRYAKEVFIRDSICASFGYIICFFTALNIFGGLNYVYSLAVIIGVIFLYPTIKTNRAMGIRYRKIVKILGDNFDLYFSCNEE